MTGKNENECIAFENIKAEMARNHVAVRDMAEAAGITTDVMCSKLSGELPVNLNEAFLIAAKCFPDCSIWELFQELADEKGDG